MKQKIVTNEFFKVIILLLKIRGGILLREGLIPAILGTAVTATGLAMRGYDMKKRGMTKRDTTVAIGAGVLGFGLAHVVLGSIDLIQK